MRILFVGIGAILIIIGGVMAVVTVETYKESSWSDVSQATPTLTTFVRYAYVTLDLTAGQTVRATVTPTESSDAILLMLLTLDQYNTGYMGSSGITQSEAIEWVQPTALGQQVSFEHKIITSGSYVIILHGWRDNGASPWANGIPFSFTMRVSEPLSLTIPGIAVAVIGIAIAAYGVISKPKKPVSQAMAPPPPPPM